MKCCFFSLDVVCFSILNKASGVKIVVFIKESFCTGSTTTTQPLFSCCKPNKPVGTSESQATLIPGEPVFVVLPEGKPYSGFAFFLQEADNS